MRREFIELKRMELKERNSTEMPNQLIKFGDILYLYYLHRIAFGNSAVSANLVQSRLWSKEALLEIMRFLFPATFE